MLEEEQKGQWIQPAKEASKPEEKPAAEPKPEIKEKSVLDKPEIAGHEQILKSDTPKRSKFGLIMKTILVLAILGGIFYLITHTAEIQAFANDFFGNLLN